MPIEIRELVIKAELSEGSNNASQNTQESGRGTDERFIQEVVDRVMDVLESKLER